MANKAFVNQYASIGAANKVRASYVVVNTSGSYVSDSTVDVTFGYSDNACSVWDQVVTAIHAVDSSLIVVNAVP